MGGGGGVGEEEDGEIYRKRKKVSLVRKSVEASMRWVKMKGEIGRLVGMELYGCGGGEEGWILIRQSELWSI